VGDLLQADPRVGRRHAFAIDEEDPGLVENLGHVLRRRLATGVTAAADQADQDQDGGQQAHQRTRMSGRTKGLPEIGAFTVTRGQESLASVTTMRLSPSMM